MPTLPQMDVSPKGWGAIPQNIGKGFFTSIDLKVGIRLIVMDFRLSKPAVFEFQVPERFLGFGFCLSGDIEGRAPGFKDSFYISGGQSAFFSYTDAGVCTEAVGPERVLRVSMVVNPELADSLETEKGSAIPGLLKDPPKGCRSLNTITQPMRAVLDQMLRCPYSGMTRELFIQGKALELAAYKIEQIEGGGQHIPKASILSSDNVKRVRHAAWLLNQDLENAPSLDELARKVGMCRSKLHQCFCQAYGITPFDYLRNQRFEAALRYLQEGKMNVTETAYAVGYSSLSHFTKAFKKHFGFPPGKCLKTAA